MRRSLVLALAVLALAVLVLAAPAAGAQSVLDVAAEALRSDPVYVDPEAERSIASDDAARLRQAIRASDEPVFVAILRSEAVDEAGGDPNDVSRELGRRTGPDGTYAVVVGDSFRAASGALAEGEAGRIATRAFQAQRTRGTTAVLLAFVDGVAAARSGASDDGDADDGGTSLAPVLFVGGAGALGVWAWRSRRRRRRRLLGRIRGGWAGVSGGGGGAAAGR